MTALVRGVMARSTRPGSRLHGRLVDVDIDRPRADVRDGPAGGDEGVGRGDDLVAGPDVEQPHRHMQGGGAAVEADAMRRPGEGGEGALEIRHVRSEAERAGVERARNRRIEFGAQRTDLRR